MPELTAERVRELLEYNPVTGEFCWRNPPNGRTLGQAACSKNGNGYLRTRVDYRLYYNHRLAWLWVHGEWPKHTIDHANGARDDNRLCNLRDVPHRNNIENQRRTPKNSTTGFLGVYWDAINKKFRARIVTNGKRISIGRYTTPEEAHQAYLTAKRQLHAGCTI